MEYCLKAVMNGAVDIVRWFMQNGFNINQQIKTYPVRWKGYHLLDVAISRQDVNMVACLLEFGSNPNLVAAGSTSFHLAMKQKSADIILLMLRHGANIYTKDGSGRVPKDYLDGIQDTALYYLMTYLGCVHEDDQQFSLKATPEQLLSFYLGIFEEESLIKKLPISVLEKHIFPKCVSLSCAKNATLTKEQCNAMIDTFIHTGEFRQLLQWSYDYLSIDNNLTTPPYLGPTPLWRQWNDSQPDPDIPPTKKRNRDFHLQT